MDSSPSPYKDYNLEKNEPGEIHKGYGKGDRVGHFPTNVPTYPLKKSPENAVFPEYKDPATLHCSASLPTTT